MNGGFQKANGQKRIPKKSGADLQFSSPLEKMLTDGLVFKIRCG